MAPLTLPEETFYLKRASRWVRYGLPSLVLLSLMALATYYWFTLPPTGWGPPLCQLLDLLLLTILVAVLRFQYPTVLTIGPQQVALEENDWTITLAYSDIKYLREYHPDEDPAYLQLEPQAKGSTIRISSRFTDYERIRQLLGEHLPVYNAPAAAPYLAQRGAAATLPPATQPGNRPARQARRWARGLTLAAFAVLVAQLASLPYLPAMALCLALPLAATGALRRYQGRLHLSTAKQDPRPDVALAMWLPIGAVLFYHILHFKLVVWQPLWWPAAGIALGFWLLLCWAIGAEARRRDPLLVAQALLMGAGYGLCMALSYNCAPGYQPPLRYATQVASLYTTYSKGTHYYLTPQSWGPAGSSEAFQISQQRYERLQVGDTISLWLYQGRLGADWARLAGPR